jgi:flagellin
MTMNSINTNLAALRAQENIGVANRMSSSSIARLSSGERIVRAADDVASMSAGTALRTNVTTLRTALINTSQGASMLQVADGALTQITDILLRQKAIAVQSGAGSLSSAERAFLDQEFQNLSAEIDRLAKQTNFNGVNLLDGSVLSSNRVETNTEVTDSAVARIRVTAAVANATAVTINGVAVESVAVLPAPTTATQFNIGASVAETAANLLTYLQNSTNRQISALNYSLEGTDTIVVTSPSGGTANTKYTVVAAGAFGAVTAGAGDRLIGSADNGFLAGSVQATGAIADTILFAQNQQKAQARISFNSAATIGAGATIEFGGVAALLTEGTDFTRQLLADGTTLDLRATLDEIVGAFNRVAPGNLWLDQVNVFREGNDIVFENKMAGEVLAADFLAAATGIGALGGIAGHTVINATLAQTGQRETGVNTNAITNDAFIGTVKGFQATYVAQNRIDISITVGDRTYTAQNVNVAINNRTDLVGGETRVADTTPAVRLRSAEGDYFDIDLMGLREGLTAGSQLDANRIAGRLDAALSGLTFTQNREIQNFNPIGGARAWVNLSNFDNFVIGNVNVTRATSETGNAIVEFVAGGEIFRSEGLGAHLRNGTALRFVSTTNPNHVITYQHGQSNFRLNTEDGAAAFENYLRTAFNVGADGAGANFQVGVTTTDTIKVSVGVATTQELFGGKNINVLTQESSAQASDVLDAAIKKVTALRADVGALQSRFDFASANIQSSLQNQDAARGVLLDTDIAAESTAFATAQVRLQAGISVLAQANLLSQNLLKLIG